ncbi:MAG: hypothetical protein ABEJ70_04515 [Halobacteriaceae archaeon]
MSATADAAERILLSYRAPDIGEEADDSEWVLQDSGWIQEGLHEHYYLQYLRKVHGGPIAVGDEWEEFVNCGCASPQDVILRVEEVTGGTALGPETEIRIVPRRDLVGERAARA